MKEFLFSRKYSFAHLVASQFILLSYLSFGFLACVAIAVPLCLLAEKLADSWG